jgi:hypothetical protein
VTGAWGHLRRTAILSVAASLGVIGLVANRSGALPADTSTAAAGPSVAFSPATVPFGKQRVATHGPLQIVIFTNTGDTAVTLQSFTLAGDNPDDFYGFTDCFPNGAPAIVAVGGHCRVGLYFTPTQTGARHALLRAIDSAPTSPQSVSLSGTGTEGYFVADARGEVGNFGDAVFRGDATNIHLAAPIISLATTPNGGGYWLLGSDGGIFTYGNARFHGSTGAMKLNKPIVALFPSASGNGYWLVGSDGGIFTFGDALFYGSTGAMTLNKPIDGMASTPTGRGYWLVGSDGGIFTFGDAHFYGSAGGAHLTSPVVQMTPTRSGHGYWLVTADGHLYAFGDAHNYGSAVGHAIVGMALTSDGRGYWEVSRNGQIFVYGDAHRFGDLAALGVDDVVGIAATAPPLFSTASTKSASVAG